MKAMVNLRQVIEELVEDRGVDRAVLDGIIQEGMLAAYQKRYPELTFKVDTDLQAGELIVSVQKDVVATVEDDDTEISQRKARFTDKKIKIGDKVWVPFAGKIGRVDVLKAKQVIASSIRNIESEAVYKEFKDKEGTIIHGTIHKCERNGASVKVQDTFAFLPKSLTPPTDKCIVGYPVRALLKEVLTEPRHENQLILDRSSTDFLLALFELEIPEIFEHLVEIKKIARIAGYKSKVIVVSNDPNIDPVGTCVGLRGVRIKPILKELGGEKIDIIPWSDSLEERVKLALKPAEVNRVEVVDNTHVRVWLDDDQRSIAIGKRGQNITLAAELTGVSIDLVQSETVLDRNQSLGDLMTDDQEDDQAL